MNRLNEHRAQAVAEQLGSFRPEDATPTSDFAIEPEYTLIARVPEDIGAAMQLISNELQSQFPEHYYYSPAQYHLTIVPIPIGIKPATTVETIAPIVRLWRLPIEARGLGFNRFQASVVLYPKEESLISQRTKLRQALGIPDQAFTIHRPVWDELLWVNFMRFRTKPTENLLTCLRARADQYLGSFTIDRYELYYIETKTLDLKSSKLLHSFE